MKLYINLLNFNSDKIAGAGYFMKRLFEQIDFSSSVFQEFDEIVILHNKHLAVQKTFSIPSLAKFRYKPVGGMNRFVNRILYEQLILPFALIGRRGIYYSPTPVIPLLCAVFKLNSLRLISTIHDMIPFYLREKYGRLRSVYIRAISKASAKYSHSVITVSQNSKSDIIALTNIPGDKIFVVYNFLPKAEFKKEKVVTPTFITVSTIEPGKNIENTIKGFKRFTEKYNSGHYHYFIIGKNGWNYTSILQELNSLQISDKVHLTGYLDEKEKDKYISQCTGMLYLSKYEGFGIPPMEAMYFGKPSVVSNSSSLPEVVGKAGVICKEANSPEAIADSIYHLITNREKYINEIPEQLEKFDPETQVKEFIATLELNVKNA